MVTFNQWRSIVDGTKYDTSTIPDSSMFQDPIYQYNALRGLGDPTDGAELSDWIDVLNSVTASATGGPVYRDTDTDGSGQTKATVAYDGAESHTAPTDSNMPGSSGAVSFAATFKFQSSNVNFDPVVGTDDAAIAHDSGEIKLAINTGDNIASGITPGTDRYLTAGWSFDGDTTYEIFVNGSQRGTINRSQTPGNSTVYINDSYFGASSPMEVHDVVVCATDEQEQAFTDYHNDRL